MTTRQTRRHVLFVFAGVAVLMLKPHYHGPLAPVLFNYVGNFAVSFAVYFIVGIAASRHGWGRWIIVAAALLAVELFEITDGFGIMSNVFDPLDLLANAAGIGLAFAVDSVTRKDWGRTAKG